MSAAGRLHSFAGTSGCALYGMGLPLLACWDCGFESHWGIDVYPL